MKRVFLFDGTALVHRSFHAFAGPVQLTSHGLDVGMIYGFLNSLFMVIRKEKPDLLAITFDTSAPTFRHKKYAEYKANRPPLDEGIREQLSLLYEIVDLLNIPRLYKDGWEADDLMGTLAKRGKESGLETYLVTGDKDFYQLVDDKVKVYTLPTKKERNPVVYDSEKVKEKFGVPPEKVIDVLALMGDSSDNVPGVPKVGQKTAVKLLDEFGGLDSILESAKDMKKSKLRDNLVEFANQARLSRELVVIDADSPIEIKPEELTYGPLNNKELRQRLAELDFNSILRQLDEIESADNEDSGDNKQIDEVKYHQVSNREALKELYDVISKSELVSFDTETTAVDAMQAELVGLSFGVEEKEAWYVSVNHFEKMPETYEPPFKPKLRPNMTPEAAFILNRLKPFFEDPVIHKTGQNLKYDAQVLKCYDIPVDGVKFDTMIASHVLDSSARQHNIDILAEKHLGYRKVPTSDLIGSGSRQISMRDVPLNIITNYACEDADIALRLSNLMMARIRDEGFERLMYEQEMPAMEVLLEMEHNGVALDLGLLAEMSREFAEETAGLKQEVYELAGGEFNLNSTQQLADVMYNRLGLPSGRKTKFGFSTDITELERLAQVHPLPAKLLRYRHLTKLKSTYIDALPRLIHPITNRVHTTFSQTIAATGRLSSNDPNLQNIPIRTEDGGRIRKAFIAGEPGWKIISADYSQIELRIMAHLSGDENMIRAFSEGMDIHRATAAWMHDMPQEMVTPDIRRQAKEVNFGVLYGMGGFGLSQRLKINRKRADEFIEQYFKRFSRVKAFIDEIISKAKETGYVETIMGRKRPLPDINSKSFRTRQNAERIATNTPIQGSAADLMKLAMIDVHNMMKAEKFKARMLLQVHDELLFEAPEDELETFSAKLREVMESTMELKVPLEVEVNHGDNWLDAH